MSLTTITCREYYQILNTGISLSVSDARIGVLQMHFEDVMFQPTKASFHNKLLKNGGIGQGPGNTTYPKTVVGVSKEIHLLKYPCSNPFRHVTVKIPMDNKTTTRMR